MLYVFSNTKAIFEAQFMKKLNETEGELKKRVAYKRKAEKLVIIEHIIIKSEAATSGSVKKAVLKNLINFTGNHLCWNLFSIKSQAIR